MSYGEAHDLTPAEALQLESNRGAHRNVSEQCLHSRAPQ